MKTGTSTYLDMLRFLAALVVFLGHVGSKRVGDGLFWQFIVYGAPAVVVFFVLSGFVIGYVSHQKERNSHDYIIARAARLYSVVVPTLLITACLDWAGSVFSPSLYTTYDPIIGPGIWQLPVCLAFLNEAWGAHVFPGSDGSYWSLSYEVTYYAIFGIVFYGSGVVRIFSCTAVGILAGPRILTLFPIWLLGWGAYNISRRQYINRRAGYIGFFGSVLGVLLFIYFARRYGVLSHFSALFDHNITDTLQEYLLAFIIFVNIISFDAVSDAFDPIVQYVMHTVRWLSGATFTLYLLHFPILVFISATAPWPRNSWQYHVTIIVIPLCAVFLIAQVTERKKRIWRHIFTRLYGLRHAPV